MKWFNPKCRSCSTCCELQVFQQSTQSILTKISINTVENGDSMNISTANYKIGAYVVRLVSKSAGIEVILYSNRIINVSLNSLLLSLC